MPGWNLPQAKATMSTFSILPGLLNVRVVQGDAFSCGVDFTVDLTAYTVEAEIYSTASGDTVKALTTNAALAADGKINVSLTPEQTAALPRGTYRWRLTWQSGGSNRRTALYGFFEVTK